MRLLSLLHRWTGALIGLLLAVIGLSGAALVWKDSWIAVPHAHDAVRASDAALAHVMEAAGASGGEPLSRITFAGPQLGVHQAIYADGSGAYFAQSGERVAHWTSAWHRPELWLFDLHHRLFTGETGVLIAGIAGLIGIAFVVTGSILWWRTRRTFRFRLWPARMTPSAIVRQHRDIGIVTAPLLLLSMATGAAMIFTPLGPWIDKAPVPVAPTLNPPERIDWHAIIDDAHRRFPDAAIRRIQYARKPHAPVIVRLAQRFEWTPNGRSYVYFDPASARMLAASDPRTGSTAARLQEKFYPVHAARVGGIVWKLAMTLSGLVLTLLGSLAVYGFWRARLDRSRARARHPIAIGPKTR